MLRQKNKLSIESFFFTGFIYGYNPARCSARSFMAEVVIGGVGVEEIVQALDISREEIASWS